MAKRRPNGECMIRQKKKGQWEGRIVVGHKENGKPIFRYVYAKTLSGILGHTNASFTLDTYTHVTTDMQKRASEIVGNFMNDILGEELKT